MVAGSLVGLMLGVMLVSSAWTGELTDDTSLTFYAIAGVVLVGGIAVGMFATQTVGIAMVPWLFACAIAAVVVAFRGEWGYVLPLVANATAAVMVQRVLVRVLQAKTGVRYG